MILLKHKFCLLQNCTEREQNKQNTRKSYERTKTGGKKWKQGRGDILRSPTSDVFFGLFRKTVEEIL